MPYVLAARNEAAGKYRSLVRSDELHEEERIVDFLCGLLVVIRLWLRNRLGLRKATNGPQTMTSCERPGTHSSGRAMTLMLRPSLAVSAPP